MPKPKRSVGFWRGKPSTSKTSLLPGVRKKRTGPGPWAQNVDHTPRPTTLSPEQIAKTIKAAHRDSGAQQSKAKARRAVGSVAVQARPLEGGAVEVTWAAVPKAHRARVDVRNRRGTRINHPHLGQASKGTARLGKLADCRHHPLTIVVQFSDRNGNTLAEGQTSIDLR